MVEDVVAIEQLMSRYCHAVDVGSAEEVADLFHANAVLKPTYSGQAAESGRDAIRAWYQRYNETFRAKATGLRHCVTSPRIDVSGAEARARTYFDADFVSESGTPTLARGVYEDRFVKDGARWRFAEKEILLVSVTESKPVTL
jgi:hypothetical protein